jgi:hypothetical protein
LITFQPASADRKDAILAETLDVIFKTLWMGELDMDQVTLSAAAWLIAAGEAYFETCADYAQSSQQFQLQAPATLSLNRPDGSTIERDTGALSRTECRAIRWPRSSTTARAITAMTFPTSARATKASSPRT